MPSQKTSLKEKGLTGILMFIFGFAGMSIIGAIVITILVALGILPAI